ncbi:GNAT family N-acetyltransferase [Desulfobulbus elongatus]|uniref:GNAT family N-acetyltransferase n=1 Tax=Desulfobulbus elongatus TaxID=53332 RepID=UPI0004874585|nr:GNAT family N-acetyltransferase [Desulfobulbus elongatus]
MTIFGDRIFTIRLQLRRIEAEDLELLAGWSNDPLACGSYLTPENLSVDQLAVLLASGVLWSEHSKTFLIELRDGQPIGTVHYWIRPEERKTAVIAIKIARPEQRSRGYGTEAQKYLILFLFNRLDIRQVEMYTDMNNLPQQRCLQKLGFELAQTLPYTDQRVQRVGHLYRLCRQGFARQPIYQHHYA